MLENHKQLIAPELRKLFNIVVNFNQLNNPQVVGRRLEYSYIGFKIVNIFKSRFDDISSIFTKIKRWFDVIITTNFKDFEKLAKRYLYDLLTIDSMMGTWIENDIKRQLSKSFNIRNSTTAEDKRGIDGWINNKACSIKSIKYRNSPYKKNAALNIEKVIKGPIIYYKRIEGGDIYVIDNLEDIMEHYSK